MNDNERYIYWALVEQTCARSLRTEMASDCLLLTSLPGFTGLMESSFARSSARLWEPSVVIVGAALGESECGPWTPWEYHRHRVWWVPRSLRAGHLLSEPYFFKGLEQSLIWDQIPVRHFWIAMEKTLCLRITLIHPFVYGLLPVNSRVRCLLTQQLWGDR